MPANNPMAYVSDIGRRNRRKSREDVERGGMVEDEYLERARAYDPSEAARTAARASFEEVEEDFGRNLETLRGSQVARGRVGSQSGFGFEEEDELYRESMAPLMRTLAQNALQTSRLNLENIRDIGGYGERTTMRGLDLAASERDAGLQLEEMRRRDEERKRSGLFGLVGRAAGTLLGPAGSFVGGELAEGLEGLIRGGPEKLKTA